MENKYDKFRLIGYKINEMSNGDFLAQRPDKTVGLFNKESNLILGGFESIRQISNELYAGLKGLKVLLFNRQGEIIDEADSSCNWESLYPVDNTRHYVCIFEDFGLDALANVYSLDGKIQFKGVPWNSQGIIYRNGKAQLVYHKKEALNTQLILLDTEGNKEYLDIGSIRWLNVNNHYIHTLGVDNIHRVLDFKGQIVYEGSKLVIDDINLDNDTVVSIHKNAIDIYSKLNNLQVNYKAESNIIDVKFTSNKNILNINETSRGYVLNIRTLQKTPSNFNMAKTIADIVISKVVDNVCSVCKLNLDTFEITEVFKCNYCGYTLDYIIPYNGEEESYYTLDLKPLIREFE